MFRTLLEIENSTVANIAGVASGGPQFIQYVNEAVEELMRRGDFSGLDWPIQVCVRKGSIAWPRYVGQVRSVNICHHLMQMESMWSQFLPRCNDWHSRYHCGRACRITQAGKVATYNDIAGLGWTLQAWPLLAQDAGKTMTIYGVDNLQQPLRHQNLDGSWSDGMILTLAYRYGTTATTVYRIDRVLRDATQGQVNLFAVNANGIMQDLASYEPAETNPEYARSMLELPCGVDCGTFVSILAMVKLRFIPAVADSDLVLIDNLEALKAMIQSIRFAEAGDDGNAKLYEGRAIRSLNLQLSDEMPTDQMPVTVEPFSGVRFGQNTF